MTQFNLQFQDEQFASFQHSEAHQELVHRITDALQGGEGNVTITYLRPEPLWEAPGHAFYPYLVVTTDADQRSIPERWYYGWQNNRMVACPVNSISELSAI